MELKHYGIKGMHWGIRRYQPYPDGSPAGKFVGNKKAAKKIVRRMNKNSQMHTLRSYYEQESGKRYAHYTGKAEKAQAKGNVKKYDKLMDKANKEYSEMKTNKQMAEAAKKAVNDSISKLKKNGFDVRSNPYVMQVDQKGNVRIMTTYEHFKLGKDNNTLDNINNKLVKAEMNNTLSRGQTPKEGSVGALVGVGGTLAIAGTVAAAKTIGKKVSKMHNQTVSGKEKARQSVRAEKYAEDSLERLKDNPKAINEVRSAANKMRDAQNKSSDYYYKFDVGGDQKAYKKYEEWEKKSDDASYKYSQILKKHGFDDKNYDAYNDDFIDRFNNKPTVSTRYFNSEREQKAFYKEKNKLSRVRKK